MVLKRGHSAFPSEYNTPTMFELKPKNSVAQQPMQEKQKVPFSFLQNKVLGNLVPAMV
jgi:hypothetical protein